jgi:hypothetical protein
MAGCFTLQAQDYIDLAKVYYANTPLNQFDSTTQGSRVEEMNLDITLPVRLNTHTALLTGLYLEKITTQTSPITNLNSVYTINLRLGLNLKHGEKWTGTYLLLPKLSSDLQHITGKDFQMGVLVLLKYLKQENLNYKMGLYYNSELFGPFFVPILGLYYQSPNTRFEADLSLPLSADMNYALQSWLHAGLNFNGFIRSYYISLPQYAENGEYLVKSTSEISAYLQFTLWNNLLLQTRAGYSIGRNYRIYDASDKITIGISAFRFGDDRKQLNTDFKDGAVFSTRLLYRLPIND